MVDSESFFNNCGYDNACNHHPIIPVLRKYALLLIGKVVPTLCQYDDIDSSLARLCGGSAGRIIITEYGGGLSQVSLYTLTGELVSCIGDGRLSSPRDVDFAPNGDILIANTNEHCVLVYSPDGTVFLRRIGDPGKIQRLGGKPPDPVALAVHNCRLYVLDSLRNRVYVYQ